MQFDSCNHIGHNASKFSLIDVVFCFVVAVVVCFVVSECVLIHVAFVCVSPNRFWLTVFHHIHHTE